MIRGEVLATRRVVQQPLPHLHPGGDCGACVLAGVLGLSVAEAYQAANRPVADGFDWYRMREALFHLQAHGHLDRIIVDIPTWQGTAIQGQMFWGNPSWSQSLQWFAYVRMALDAGYYGIGCVNHAKLGPGHHPDHFVLIAGAREVWPDGDEGGAIHKEILVSCSSRSTPDEEWVDVHDFLKTRGGFNLFLARPTQ